MDLGARGNSPIVVNKNVDKLKVSMAVLKFVNISETLFLLNSLDKYEKIYIFI